MKNIKLFKNPKDYLDSEIGGFITSIVPGVGYLRDEENEIKEVFYNPTYPLFFFPTSMGTLYGTSRTEAIESFNAMKPAGDIFLFKPNAISNKMWAGDNGEFDINIYDYVTEEFKDTYEGEGSAYTMTVQKKFAIVLTDYTDNSQPGQSKNVVKIINPFQGLKFSCVVYDGPTGACGWEIGFANLLRTDVFSFKQNDEEGIRMSYRLDSHGPFE